MVFTRRVFFAAGKARRGLVSYHRAVDDKGLGEGAQRTHKPLVGSSNLPLATEVNHDQQLRESREVVGHFSACDKGLRGKFVTNVSIIVT